MAGSMEEFKQKLQTRRVTVLSGLKRKMDVLRTENQFLKDLLQMHNIECPPLEEITGSVDVTDDSAVNSDSLEEEDAGGPSATRLCLNCESLESDLVRVKRELRRTQNDLQEANGQLLEQTTEVQKIRNHCQALKDVNRIIKELIGIRDQELTQLKEKFKEIEQTMSERETEIMSENLRTEYTRQLENIRRLKTLYEQRARSADAEIEILKRKIADKSTEVDNELLKNQEKEQRITLNENEITKLGTELSTTRDTLKDNRNEMELLQNDLRTINSLFTRILTNRDNFDLDRLKNVLEENRMLLTEVTTRSNDCSIIADSVLPKLLCDLIVGAFADPQQMVAIESNELEETAPLFCVAPDLVATDDIIENLPKIWRIITELLIHQKATAQLHIDATGKSQDCYKTVDTPTGPQLVLSVSKTFIKLKDLILEKKGLQKETKRLKVLNEHLQQTLNSQEDRLGAVSVEVTKTWHLVNRMQRQHRQLHTKEQVLRYHLQQKRRMLNELKEELETCRHKWTKAREKNESSEIQWKLLRDEFTSRKNKSESVESGFSDEQGTTDEDADGGGDIKDKGESAATGDQHQPQQEEEIMDPIDETLEQMFYRLNAIHTVNSLNFEPVLEEPPITPYTPSETETEREHAFERNRSMEVYEELPPGLIDDQDMMMEQSGLEVESVNAISPEIEESLPGPSTESFLNLSEDPSPTPVRSTGLTTAEEEYTARRNERIKRLEEQCKQLFDKMTSTKKKNEDINKQLDTIQTRQLERGINLNTPQNAGEGTSAGNTDESVVLSASNVDNDTPTEVQGSAEEVVAPVEEQPQQEVEPQVQLESQSETPGEENNRPPNE